jgi:hypothetical protein
VNSMAKMEKWSAGWVNGDERDGWNGGKKRDASRWCDGRWSEVSTQVIPPKIRSIRVCMVHT